VPFAVGHYIENTGSAPLRFLEMFRTPTYHDVSLNQWMKLTPHSLMRAHLHIDEAVLEALPEGKVPVVPG